MDFSRFIVSVLFSEQMLIIIIYCRTEIKRPHVHSGTVLGVLWREAMNLQQTDVTENRAKQMNVDIVGTER